MTTYSYEYGATHRRFRQIAGMASGFLCEGGCGRRALDWAIIHGRAGLELFRDFVPLCRSCHLKYDFTEERRSKISAAAAGDRARYEKTSAALRGKPWSAARRRAEDDRLARAQR